MANQNASLKTCLLTRDLSKADLSLKLVGFMAVCDGSFLQ